MASYNFFISPKECKQEAKECLRGTWKQTALTTLLYFSVIGILILTTILLSLFVSWWISIPLGIFTLLIWGLLSYGYNVYVLNLAQGKDAKISNLFAGFSKKFFSIVKLTLKQFFLLVFWTIILIFPFFIKLITYSMSRLLIADGRISKEQSPIKESKHLVKNNYSRYFNFVITFAGWFVLGILSGGIGLIWIYPYYMTNKAIFYENLKTEF